ncbi:MAG: TonB-dependent receptor [Proteobacteria bacterium]|nr:TonB-dependent receptor [Pseudomonadota bacterium]
MQRTGHAVVFALTVSVQVLAADNLEPGPLEEMVIIGFTPVRGVGLPMDRLPYRVQGATGEDISQSQSLDISDYMNRYMHGIQIAHSQNNPLQPDVQYRGYTASPLLGNSQGLSVYMNGVRINEPFGDAINWDIIPQAAIAELNLMGGSNPLFGLNTLGGALSLRTKNGFRHTGDSLQLEAGSFARRSVIAESGGNNGDFSYYLTANSLTEEGWRDHSDSDVQQLFGSVGWQDKNTEIELSLSLADTDLNGNGSAPVELLAIDRKAVFTHPDNTRNDLVMATLFASHRLSATAQMSTVLYARDNNRETFNGDGSDYDVVQAFDSAGNGYDADGEQIVSHEACDGACSEGQLVEEGVPLVDQNGVRINPGLEDDALAVNNNSETRQDGLGLSVQLTLMGPLNGAENSLVVGFSYDQADIAYRFATEVAEFTTDRGTLGGGLIDASSLVDARVETNTTSLYALDSYMLSETISLSLSGRYNRTRVDISGTHGEDNVVPEGETGRHTFSRFNPAVGLVYVPDQGTSFYLSYGESSRVPTAAELTCHDQASPCVLPNAFLSDPPLDQVVAKTWELGLRGKHAALDWHAGVFYTVNKDDIYFLPTEEGPGLSPGYFDNIGSTSRTGVELSVNGSYDRWRWFAGYNWLDAVFEDAFVVVAENNPYAIAHGLVSLQVDTGSQLPGVSEHSAKAGVDWQILTGLSVGVDGSWHSSSYFRGDEANLSSKVGSYALVNAHASYSLGDHLEVFARVDNIFDREYESFGLYGQPDEAPGFDNFSDTRFMGAGAPRGAWVGIKLAL